MTTSSDRSTAASWARFRFSVVGSLLSSPPARGELKAAIRSLAAKTWTHPVSGRTVRFAAVTIERWYYTARREKDDPVGVLRRSVRKDCGRVSLAASLAEHLFRQYHDHPHWSYQLHYDNLAARVKVDPSLGPLHSYSTVRRYMQAHGLVRKPRLQRRSDGTISLCGVRFEIPARYRHFRDVSVRYARWDLGRVDLVDPRSGATLAAVYPLDRGANADGRRLAVGGDAGGAPADAEARPDKPLPPLLKNILDEYSALGTPPAYLPKRSPATKGEDA